MPDAFPLTSDGSVYSTYMTHSLGSWASRERLEEIGLLTLVRIYIVLFSHHTIPPQLLYHSHDENTFTQVSYDGTNSHIRLCQFGEVRHPTVHLRSTQPWSPRSE